MPRNPKPLPYDQCLARWMVRPLSRTPVTPNQITLLTLVMALAAAWLFASGQPDRMAWAAGLFVLARFLDHFDGELARMTGRASRLGYYLDYVVGGISYGALFLGLGIGLAEGVLGYWALVLGVLGMISAILSMLMNVAIDRGHELPEGQTAGYPYLAGFELEDGIYFLAPVTWLDLLEPFFVAAGLGAAAYLLWTFWTLLRLWVARARSTG